MTKSDSKLRIRQVAIVLSCVDTSTKQRLLGQLPPDQARLVRQEIAKLGDVDPREREEAMKAFQTRSQGSTEKPRSSSPSPQAMARSRTTTPNRSRYPDDSSDWDDRESNPAAELIENTSNEEDSVDINYSNDDYKSYSPDTRRSESFEPVNAQQSDPFSASLDFNEFPPSSGAEIARLISGERPTVIATVLRQVSNALGAAILAALPSKVAALTLSTLPNLEAIDPAIMKDIQESLREKLSVYRGQLSPDAPRIQHIQSLLSYVPQSQRKLVEQELLNENATLASSLGISPSDSRPGIPTTASETSSPIAYSASLSPAHSLSQSDSISNAKDLHASSSEETSDYEDDSFADSESALLTFEDLEDLSIESLATVFRASDPNTILIAVSGAAIQMRSRLESMIDPGNIGQLRAKIETFANVDAQSRKAARRAIAKAANQLLLEEKIELPRTSFKAMVA